eukprot:XP_001696243.1 predicted protein [Chlamydomonas reinhardtii]
MTRSVRCAFTDGSQNSDRPGCSKALRQLPSPRPPSDAPAAAGDTSPPPAAAAALPTPALDVAAGLGVAAAAASELRGAIAADAPPAVRSGVAQRWRRQGASHSGAEQDQWGCRCQVHALPSAVSNTDMQHTRLPPLRRLHDRTAGPGAPTRLDSTNSPLSQAHAETAVQPHVASCEAVSNWQDSSAAACVASGGNDQLEDKDKEAADGGSSKGGKAPQLKVTFGLVLISPPLQ